VQPAVATNAADQMTVSVSADFSTGTATTSPNSESDCADALCQASASITSPIEGSFEITVTVAGTTVADLTIGVNLGELTASTSYREAPSA
ncbi:MAG: hypothetical protein ACRD6W_02925, partial [Nitrososphaerales archaeon]